MYKNYKLSALILFIFFTDFLLGLAVLISNLFLNIQESYNKISISTVISYDLLETSLLVSLEVGLALGFFMYRNLIFNQQTLREEVLRDIAEGENENLEFKETLRWDCNNDKCNKSMEEMVLKTLAGFMNTNGGRLIVGVTDKREIIGLANDFKTLKKPNRDGFENHLSQLIIEAFGIGVRKNLKIYFEIFKEGVICIIDVQQSDKPIYIKNGQNEHFYIRVGNGTRSLTVSEATEYIMDHWKKS